MSQWIATHLAHVILSSGFILTLALKLFGRKLLDKIMDYAVNKVLTNGDNHDKALVLALVKWAEAKIPEAGTGGSKFTLVDTTLTTMAPHLSADQRKELIEAGVTLMEQSLQNAEKKLAPPAT